MKRIWTGLVAAIVLATPALAADLAISYKVPAPVAPPPSWAGFYIGINGGGGLLNSDILDPECFLCADTTFHTGFGTVGGQVGYNWQINSFVYGLEGDLNWASAKQSGDWAADDGTTSVGTATAKMDAFATLRGRLGLAVGPTMIYVTGGPAWGHFNSSVVSGGVLTSTIFYTVTDNEWRFGLAAGAGVEYMVTNNWTLRGEFLFLDFLDSQPAIAFATSGTTCSGGLPCKISFANTASVVRLGLNYKF